MPPPDLLRSFLEEARAQIDEGLERFLPAPPACPPLLSEAMRYSLFAGGKRLRPILTLAAADASARLREDASAGQAPVGEDATARQARSRSQEAMALALPAACAIEFIHTYSLIHDDLPAMDNDTLRRGRPTLHVVYGDAVAILAGDGLQAEAFLLLAREPKTSNPDVMARKLKVLGLIAEAAGASGMVGGQMVDVQAAGQARDRQLSLDPAGLRDMHLRKTGALIRASAVSGAIMAGADADTVGAIASWAEDVGLAFQIVDDLLDVEGDATDLGKSSGKDAAGAKPTYPSVYGLDQSRALAADCAARARAALAGAGLTDSFLNGIADWVIARKS